MLTTTEYVLPVLLAILLWWMPSERVKQRVRAVVKRRRRSTGTVASAPYRHEMKLRNPVTGESWSMVAARVPKLAGITSRRVPKLAGITSRRIPKSPPPPPSD